MAWTAVAPPATSLSAIPAFAGGPPGWPVMLRNPPMPWAMMSYAGRLAYGPVWPKPEIEQ